MPPVSVLAPSLPMIVTLEPALAAVTFSAVVPVVAPVCVPVAAPVVAPAGTVLPAPIVPGWPTVPDAPIRERPSSCDEPVPAPAGGFAS